MRTFTVKPKQNVTAAMKINTKKLESEFWKVLEKYLSKYDDQWKDYTVVEITPEEDRTRVEVRSEYLTGFGFALRMSQRLDPIVEKIDPDAYFDCEDSGILVAYIN